MAKLMSGKDGKDRHGKQNALTQRIEIPGCRLVNKAQSRSEEKIKPGPIIPQRNNSISRCDRSRNGCRKEQKGVALYLSARKHARPIDSLKVRRRRLELAYRI
jgi:hypothetical protein